MINIEKENKIKIE